MPSLPVPCEFCPIHVRKDRYGLHVKNNHRRELAAQFLEDANREAFNPIRAFARNEQPWHYPIYSRRDVGAVWFFGVRPTYFREGDSYALYIDSQENMEAHKRFVEQILNGISLLEYHNRVGAMFPLMQGDRSMREELLKRDVELVALRAKLDAVRAIVA